ncbi:MAG: R2-like ligand-binding oxidase [Acidimicrobiales bacterium]
MSISGQVQDHGPTAVPSAGSASSTAAPPRKFSEWSTPKGLKVDTVPWRLWEKAKQLQWDPADLDFSQDASDWASLGEQHRLAVAGLAQGFMIGEESVTLDIMPLILAMADEGRTEEVMYLTSFAFEEAKHVDFFRRWFTAVGVAGTGMDGLVSARLAEAGMQPRNMDAFPGIFEEELPRTMRRVLSDRSPEAVLDCSLTYNQFVEGCLAISGYRLWSQIFDELGVFPGMRKGLTLVRRDEGRHITYGTYLSRRLMAANPELLDFARDRLRYLRDYYFRYFMSEEEQHLLGESADWFQGAFRQSVERQVEARIVVLEKAARLRESEAEADFGAEEAEEELGSVA